MHSGDFFDQTEQVEMEVAGQSVKLPIFYRDASALIAVFPARMAALRRALPSRRFEPARLAPGLGAVVVACFEYRESDIGPYNEVAVAIMLNDRRRGANLPGRALARNLARGELDSFVHQLPVTTEVARQGGVRFWNYPKFIADIEFGDEPDMVACRLSQGGDHILTLRAARIATPRSGERWLHSFTWMDGQPQRGDVSINAHALGVSNRPGAAAIELGSHPIARELDRMLVSTRSIHYEHLPRYEAILHPPAALSPRLLRELEPDEARLEPTAAGSASA